MISSTRAMHQGPATSQVDPVVCAANVIAPDLLMMTSLCLPPHRSLLLVQSGPGQLFRALSVFALRDIDVTKIESRPMRSNPLVDSPMNDSGEYS